MGWALPRPDPNKRGVHVYYIYHEGKDGGNKRGVGTPLGQIPLSVSGRLTKKGNSNSNFSVCPPKRWTTRRRRLASPATPSPSAAPPRRRRNACFFASGNALPPQQLNNWLESLERGIPISLPILRAATFRRIQIIRFNLFFPHH